MPETARNERQGRHRPPRESRSRSATAVLACLGLLLTATALAEDDDSRLTIRTDSGVMAVAFSPRGDLLAAAGQENSITLWDPTLTRKRGSLRGHTSWVWNVAFSLDGRTLASASF